MFQSWASGARGLGASESSRALAARGSQCDFPRKLEGSGVGAPARPLCARIRGFEVPSRPLCARKHRFRGHCTLENTARACPRGHWACLRGHSERENTASWCLRDPLSLGNAAREGLRGHCVPEDPARACLRGHRALEKFVRGCFCVSVLLCFGSRLLGVVTLISVPLHSVPTCSVHGYARARSKSLPGRCLEPPKCSKSLFGGRLECCRLTARNHKRSHSSKSRLCASLLGCTSPGSSIAPCMYMHGYTLVYIYMYIYIY